MTFLECMNESLAYIEAHLEEEINLDEVAAIACCSSYHYQRIFACIMDITVGEYIRRRKLSMAAICLQQGKEKVIDVALKYGYQSPTAFTRAFISMHGISPGRARKQGVTLNLFPPISFQIAVKGEKVMRYRIEEKKSIRLVGMKEQISTVDGQNFIQVPAFWKRVCTQGIYEQIMAIRESEKKDMYGVCTHFRENNFDYYVAVESTREVPQCMESLEIMAGTWVVFESEGVAGIQDIFKHVYSEWFPNSGYEHAGGPEIEYYIHEEVKGAQEMKCEVWIPIIKQEK